MNRRNLLQATAAGIVTARWLAPRSAGAEPLRFPPGFVWGTATSSFQIEGRGDRTADSIWDVFARKPGAIQDHSNADIACDSYHRYPDDIALIEKAGLKAYRFSIQWPRVLPEGTGQPDERGLDYYSRMVDTALKAGIAPWVCLFHWDLPQALQDRGGWGNRDIVGWYVDYAQLIASRLGDRASHWAMFNEPQVHAVMGHGLGEHAPGLYGKDPMAAAAHHQNLAQGSGLAALRAIGGRRFQLGTVMSLQPVRPAEGLPTNREAAAQWDAVWNRAYLDPLFKGVYPTRFAPLVEKLVRPGDLDHIRQEIDFLGVNYYAPMYQRTDPAGLVGSNWGANPPTMKMTAMGWPIDPTGLIEVLADLRRNYGNPRVFITENGAYFTDKPDAQGRIDDPERIGYLRAHLAACHQAIAEGANLGGYFVWTLMDNFEWTHGYTAKFGLAAVDRATLTRLPKASYDWFARVARTNAL